jgi:hypothetical protein
MIYAKDNKWELDQNKRKKLCISSRAMEKRLHINLVTNVKWWT